jgi:chromatin modification-related protein VID21
VKVSQPVPGSDKPKRPDAQPSEPRLSPSQPQASEKDGKLVHVVKPVAARRSPSHAPTPNLQPSQSKPTPSSRVEPGPTGSAPLNKPGQHEDVHTNNESDQMDVDEPSAHVPREDANTPLAANSHDAPRPVDALSSPSSTAQTATTPAVLDTSTNTSPDHDGVQYVDRAEEKVEHEKPEGAHPLAVNNQGAADSNGLSGSTSKELEAQLLRDSADAASSVGGTIEPPRTIPHQHAGKPMPATVSHPPEAKVPSVDSSRQSDKDHSGADATAKQAPKVVLDTTGGAGFPGTDDEAATVQPNASLSQVSTFPHHTDRARTRVSTGTIRQRPVSEILSGESSNGLAAPQPSESGARSHIPITPTSQSPRPRARSLTEQSRFKEKGRLSTVVFGKQPRKTSDAAKSLTSSRPKSAGLLPTDDYFMPLFVQGFSNGTKWMKPLEQILHHAHKTISTPDSYTQILDNQACKVLRRVYSLQQQDKWSLRQPKRCPEPTRQASHWDVMLKEMKWMRTDFREERKWKTAVARNLAYACADWVALGDYPDEQRNLQVNAVTPLNPLRPRWEEGDLKWETDVNMTDGSDANGPENHSTPGLISSADTDSPLENDDDLNDAFLDALPPSAIFTLQDDEVVFGLNHSASTDRLLDELPLYGSPLKVPESDLTAPKFDPDAHWRREALPLSKYVEGQIELITDEPPRKRSRYQYAQEDDDDDDALFDLQLSTTSQLEPENPNAALFRPENKAIRDRLHAGHQFRPPNEHTMPFQTFYESRSPSQWTMSEDDELKALVREYSYNWSLISSMLSTRSMFASAAERRTPWECFERWVMLEGLPHDMQKTQYFKLWQNRIDSAQTVIRLQNQNALTQQAQQQQQQAGTNGPVTPVARRRLSLPVKVERRRNQKHLTMIDAMRKLAKKREATIQKAQHTAALAASRKAQEQPQPRAGTIKTPKEYSLMRWERDQAMAERLAERVAQHQQQRADAQRRVRTAADGSSSNANPQTQAVMQARAQQGQTAQVASVQNPQMPLNPAQMGVTHPLAGVNRANVPNQMAVNGQARPRMPMQGTPNGNAAQNHIAGTLVPPMQMNGNGQVQMPVVNGQARMTIPTQPDINLVLQAQRISEQQRQAVQMRQAQQQSHPAQQGTPALQNSPPAMRAAMANGVNQKNYINNAQAIMASFNAGGGTGMSTPPTSGLNMPAGQSGSPRPNAAMPQQFPQTFVSQLQAIESQIRQTHPNTPQDVVRQMATQLLQNRHNNLAQSAMNAAAGGQGQTAIANGPHQYAQLLRAQQQAQAAAAAQAQHQRNASGGSATPPVPTMPK